MYVIAAFEIFYKIFKTNGNKFSKMMITIF